MTGYDNWLERPYQTFAAEDAYEAYLDAFDEEVEAAWQAFQAQGNDPCTREEWANEDAPRPLSP